MNLFSSVRSMARDIIRCLWEFTLVPCNQHGVILLVSGRGILTLPMIDTISSGRRGRKALKIYQRKSICMMVRWFLSSYIGFSFMSDTHVLCLVCIVCEAKQMTSLFPFILQQRMLRFRYDSLNIHSLVWLQTWLL